MNRGTVFSCCLLASAFLMLSPKTHAQNSPIYGIVKDAKTGEPIPGVNIFLDKTTIGAFTDKNGKYVLDDLPSGRYTLVFSSVGYQRISKNISLPLAFSNEMNIELTPKQYELEQALVYGEDPAQWRRDLERFEKWFIGNTKNAEHTEILNPEVINFKRTDGQFIAQATEPLQIKNEALGYKVTFFLDYFLLMGQRFAIKGDTRFTELETRNINQKQRWKNERTRAYNGSFRQFIQSLMDNTYLEKGFRISFLNVLRRNKISHDSYTKIGAEVNHPGKMWNYVRLHQIELSTYRGYKYLKVTYKPEEPEPNIALEADLVKKLGQTSLLEFPKDRAIINTNSMTYEDPYICLFKGYWAYSIRAAEWLPNNYELPMKP